MRLGAGHRHSQARSGGRLMAGGKQGRGGRPAPRGKGRRPQLLPGGRDQRQATRQGPQSIRAAGSVGSKPVPATAPKAARRQGQAVLLPEPKRSHIKWHVVP